MQQVRLEKTYALSFHAHSRSIHDCLTLLQFPYEFYQDEELPSRRSEARQDLLGEERQSYQPAQPFSDCASESDQRDAQLWRVNSISFATSSPDTVRSTRSWSTNRTNP
jgi:hypothetical protein